MNRPWLAGLSGRLVVGLIFGALLLGVGVIFGLRARAIAIAAREVQALREQKNLLAANAERLQAELARAGDPEVVEQKAREILRWAYPEEDLVILIHRR